MLMTYFLCPRPSLIAKGKCQCGPKWRGHLTWFTVHGAFGQGPFMVNQTVFVTLES